MGSFFDRPGTYEDLGNGNANNHECRRESVSKTKSYSKGVPTRKKSLKLVETRTPYFWRAVKFFISVFLIVSILWCIVINQLALFNLADGSLSLQIRTPFLLAVSVVSDVIRICLNIFGACFSGYFGAVKPIHCLIIFGEALIEALGEILFLGFVLPSYAGEHALLLLMMALWIPALMAFGQSIVGSGLSDEPWPYRFQNAFFNFLGLIFLMGAWGLLFANQFLFLIDFPGHQLNGSQSLSLVVLTTLLISAKWWANYYYGRLEEETVDPEEAGCSLKNGLQSYIAHITGPLRFEASVIHGIFKIAIFYGATLAYSAMANFSLMDVVDGVFRNTEEISVFLRTALIAHFASSVLAYILVQLSGRVGMLRWCCAFPVMLAPFVTYLVLTLRRENYGPPWFLKIFTTVLSPLTANHKMAPPLEFGPFSWATEVEFQVLFLAWAAGLLIGRQIFLESEITNNLEGFIWHRAEGPGLFIYLNFLFNRNRNPPLQPTTVPTSLLFMAVCYWNESREEMGGSLRSIRRKVEHFVEHWDDEKRREILEVHLVVDSITEREKQEIEFRGVYLRLMDLLFGPGSVFKTSHLKPQLIPNMNRNFGIVPRDYGVMHIYQFGSTPGNPRLYIHFKDGDRGCYSGSKRLSMSLYFHEIENRIRQIAIEKGWVRTPRQLKAIYRNSFVFTADGDTLYSGASVRKLYEYIYDRPGLAGVCGTVIPIGDGPLAWFQNFEYFSAHIFNKTAEFAIGTVLCLPGCFSIYRFCNLQEVIPTYRTGVSQAIDLLVRQQGEDRWLTTLLTFKGHRLGYLSVAEALTHCPTSFDGLMIQRRRWITSSFANLWCLLSEGTRLRVGGVLEAEDDDDIDTECSKKDKEALSQYRLRNRRASDSDATSFVSVQSESTFTEDNFRTSPEEGRKPEERKPSLSTDDGRKPSLSEDEKMSPLETTRPPLLSSESKSPPEGRKFSTSLDSSGKQMSKLREFISPENRQEVIDVDDEYVPRRDKKKPAGSSRYIQWMFLLYAFINFISAIISPATIAILVTGGCLGLGLSPAYGLIAGLTPPIFFIVYCIIYDNEKGGEGNPFLHKQLWAAKILAFLYVFVVAAIIVGVGRVAVLEPTSPGAIFLMCYVSSFLLAGMVHGKPGSVLCGVVYLFFGPTMYQVLIIFAFFSFNDISWGTRGGGKTAEAKDPIQTCFKRWLRQPFINWLCRCYVPHESDNCEGGPQEQKSEEPPVQILIEERKMIEEQKIVEVYPDRIEAGDIETMKKLSEQEWTNHHRENLAKIEKEKIEYRIELIKPLSPEHTNLFRDLTNMKKNVLWVVIAANIAFYTLVVAMSSFPNFNVLDTNIFSLCLLLLFGCVQLVQTTCMVMDGVKSIARKVSYL